MTALQIFFLLISIFTLVSALMVVTSRRMMHAAFWLVLALMGVAVQLALLETRFFAVVQLLVYIGAIAILIIVGVMLTRRMMEDIGPQINRGWWAAALACVLLLVGLVWALSTWGDFTQVERAVAPGGEDVAALGRALVNPEGFVIPFEFASVLLLAAMVGAIFIASERREAKA